MTPTERYLGQFRPEFSKLHQDRDLYWAIPFSAPAVLAVVGKRFAGVDMVIEHLRSRHGFLEYTLGDELRRIAEERGVPILHRRYLQDLGDQIRAETEDAGYLARRVLRRVRADFLGKPPWSLPRSVVIGGLKTRAELKVISAIDNFECLQIETADDDVRFSRAVEHGVLAEEFEADRERRELSGELGKEELAPWDEHSEEEHREYFRDLDEIHDKGHPGGWPKEYRGAPAEVIAAVEQPQLVRNDSCSRGELHAEIDRILRDIGPAQQIVHR
jgi:hypothetical protein